MDIKDKINSFSMWYHKIDLNGTVTPGYLPHSPDAYRIPQDLTGKRILDVGAWDGYWTFEALKRGAKEVVAIDNWSDMPHLDKAYSKRVEWDTFDFCKGELGYSDEQCKRYTMDVYDVKSLGMFDVVFFFGALYHCRHPLLALDKLSEVCSDEIYIESAICNDFSPYRGPIGAGYNNNFDVVMEFYPTTQLGSIETNWWSPTLTCLNFMVIAAGWDDVETWKFENPKEAALCRGFAKGKK